MSFQNQGNVPSNPMFTQSGYEQCYQGNTNPYNQSQNWYPGPNIALGYQDYTNPIPPANDYDPMAHFSQRSLPPMTGGNQVPLIPQRRQPGDCGAHSHFDRQFILDNSTFKCGVSKYYV